MLEYLYVYSIYPKLSNEHLNKIILIFNQYQNFTIEYYINGKIIDLSKFIFTENETSIIVKIIDYRNNVTLKYFNFIVKKIDGVIIKIGLQSLKIQLSQLEKVLINIKLNNYQEVFSCPLIIFNNIKYLLPTDDKIGYIIYYLNNNDTDYEICTSLISDMSGLFMSDKNIKLNLTEWDVSNVTNMSGMFYNAINFNQDISKWNTTNVVNMSSMFENALNFNINISGWNTSNVIDMSGMFDHAYSFNQNISVWNTSKINNRNNIIGFSNKIWLKYMPFFSTNYLDKKYSKIVYNNNINPTSCKFIDDFDDVVGEFVINLEFLNDNIIYIEYDFRIRSLEYNKKKTDLFIKIEDLKEIANNLTNNYYNKLIIFNTKNIKLNENEIDLGIIYYFKGTKEGGEVDLDLIHYNKNIVKNPKHTIYSYKTKIKIIDTEKNTEISIKQDITTNRESLVISYNLNENANEEQKNYYQANLELYELPYDGVIKINNGVTVKDKIPKVLSNVISDLGIFVKNTENGIQLTNFKLTEEISKSLDNNILSYLPELTSYKPNDVNLFIDDIKLNIIDINNNIVTFTNSSTNNFIKGSINDLGFLNEAFTSNKQFKIKINMNDNVLEIVSEKTNVSVKIDDTVVQLSLFIHKTTTNFSNYNLLFLKNALIYHKTYYEIVESFKIFFNKLRNIL